MTVQSCLRLEHSHSYVGRKINETFRVFTSIKGTSSKGELNDNEKPGTKSMARIFNKTEAGSLLEEFSHPFLVLWADASQNLLAVDPGGGHQALGRLRDASRGLSLEGSGVDGLHDEAKDTVSLAEDSWILSKKGKWLVRRS